ncbi:hypothetical protein FSARC_4240 [Fusarium sarcochroum]|uniref:Uncharacterized protein n=1 Tax=Fusarium sarcochroum TaxID=1208366 RepID=A0A8H4U1T9_9HYPO|nr:hypothetical protein FSARC_4240 [Fusarium sarcochroum]
MARRNETKIVEDLRQAQSAKKRKYAIPQFTKALRREDRFQQAWDAVGGASGLASLMAEFNIRDLRDLCKRLGHTASAQKLQPQRRAALGELVTILYQGREDDRPLNNIYQNIVPACNLELVQKYEKDRDIKWTPPQEKRLFLGHRDQHERKFLDEIFSKDKNLMFNQQRKLFRGNISFTEKILTTLLAKEGKVHVPSDLIDEVAMPLLRRLLKSRYDDKTRQKYLHLVLQCIQKHQEASAGQINLSQGGLLHYTVDRWYEAPSDSESKQQFKSSLVHAIELVPTSKNPIRLDSIHQAVLVSRRLDLGARYEFFRLLLLHLKDYGVDVEGDSEQDLARLKQSTKEDTWPSPLFFSIDLKKSLRLFEKLDKLFPSSDFLSHAGHDGTVLRQTQENHKYSGLGDVEITRALLIRKSKTQDEHQGWIERACTLINERRTNAQQCREAVDRAYWARKALNLCVAAGDLETLNDTIVWAQRFTKDPVASMAIFAVQVFRTDEIEALLGAMPDVRVESPESAVSFTSSLVKQDIKLANQILVNIVETVTMAVGEPGFKPRNWTWLCDLVKAVAEQRLSRLDTFYKNLTKCSESDLAQCQRGMMDIVWQPTTDVLINVGAIIRKPALETRGKSLFNSLTSGSNQDVVKGIYVYRMLANTPLSPPLLAELARFLIDQMRARLGSEAIRAQMQDIVFIIDRLAKSDQPSLACPFIRDLILDSEGAQESSSWHRHLLNIGFLSILPSKAAREVLHTMAGAMKEKMREQNQNTDAREEAEKVTKEATEKTEASTESSKPQGPSIKVTTVKMLAQLLQHNLFIDPSSSCDILIGLLAEARHIDIRITITRSLFAVMEESTCPPNLRKRILDALEEYIVPAAAQLNERRGLTDADWDNVLSNDSNLPNVGDETPLLELLIEKVHHARLDEQDNARLAQLVMDAMEQSAVNNSRWLKLFLAKNDFTLAEHEELPHLPVHIDMLSSLFRKLMPYTSTSVFDMVRSAALVNIDPPPGIERITTAVTENRDLVNSKAGKHWLSLFKNPGRDSYKYGIMHAATVMQSPPDELESKLPENGVSVPMLRSLLIEYTERLLKIGNASMVGTLTERLCSGRFNSREKWESWRENSLPTIREIISKAAGLQTRIRNKEAEPRLMPSVFRLSLKTLPVPFSNASGEEEETFISELYVLIEDLADRPYHPYHIDFQKLKEELDYWPIHQSFGRLALKLAEVQGYELTSTDDQPRLRDYLCLEIIGHILSKVKDPQDQRIVEEVRELMNKWESCGDDAMSEMGMRFNGMLKGHSTKKIWYKED